MVPDTFVLAHLYSWHLYSADTFVLPCSTFILLTPLFCIDRWTHTYNHRRPHSSLGGLPPAVFATASTPVAALLTSKQHNETETITNPYLHNTVSQMGAFQSAKSLWLICGSRYSRRQHEPWDGTPELNDETQSQTCFFARYFIFNIYVPGSNSSERQTKANVAEFSTFIFVPTLVPFATLFITRSLQFPM